MKQDEKIDELEQLLKRKGYMQHLREFENMMDNSDNNWKNSLLVFDVIKEDLFLSN